MYPEGFSYLYNGMGTQILVPKKGNIVLFTVILQAMLLLFRSEVCFQKRKNALSKPSQSIKNV